MKMRLVLATLLAIGLALFAGWFTDERDVISETNPLQVPDNIDYYMAGVFYRAFNEAGLPRLELKSPYLEHFIREDVSQIQTPDIRYHTNSTQWHLHARHGALQHADEIFRLEQQASLHRVEPGNPLSLNTEKMVFRSRQELLEAPEQLVLKTPSMGLQAASAVLDFRNKRHRFSRVKAIHHGKSDHVPG